MTEVTREELLSFGARVREARSSASLTQEQAANEVGISLRFYQMLERGEKGPSLDTVLGLSRVFHVSVDYLLLGGVSGDLSDPLSELLQKMPPHQREDAAKILKIYQKKA